MIGIGILRGLLATSPAAQTPPDGFVHVDVDTAAAMYAARKIDLATIAVVGDPELAAAARLATSQGRDVLWIGMAPSDVRILADGFSAVVRLRIDGESFQRTMLLRADARHSFLSAASISGPETAIAR